MKKDYLKLKNGEHDGSEIEVFYLCAPSVFSGNSEQAADMEGVPPMKPTPMFNSGHCIYNPLDWHGFTGGDDLPPPPAELTITDEDEEKKDDFSDYVEITGDLSETHEAMFKGCAQFDEPESFCCPKGHKGKEGWPSGHTETSWVIMKVLNQFEDTQINMGSESAREFLAKEITKDLKNVGLLKED
jgi:hypothetical protein